jgi:hypothetical protein
MQLHSRHGEETVAFHRMTQTIVRIEVTQQSVPPARDAVIGGFASGMLGAVPMGYRTACFAWAAARLPGAKIWRLTIAVGLIAATAGLALLGIRLRSAHHIQAVHS